VAGDEFNRLEHDRTFTLGHLPLCCVGERRANIDSVCINAFPNRAPRMLSASSS
jgi:hypothetical protein